jgi:hypothetical protein
MTFSVLIEMYFITAARGLIGTNRAEQRIHGQTTPPFSSLRSGVVPILDDVAHQASIGILEN